MLSRSPSSHAKVLHSSAILCVWFHRGSPLHEHRTCPDSERSESIFYGSNGLADFWNIAQSIPAKDSVLLPSHVGRFLGIVMGQQGSPCIQAAKIRARDAVDDFLPSIRFD